MFTDLLIIFALEALYVTITTVRWIILVRGQRMLAAVISFFELILYVVALGMVVTQLHDPLRVGVYALGYAVGALVGSLAEERLDQQAFVVRTEPQAFRGGFLLKYLKSGEML